MEGSENGGAPLVLRRQSEGRQGIDIVSIAVVVIFGIAIMGIDGKIS
jgi:hypothetical protein